ncbi:hypothetical protein C943_01359 [Mariniradius saccharolyticus AK6]|uniref:Uncharacterized protein n=1 Tax=Mariniradius saccharolyticus AK6 TaxID=1239962 RepID=M7XUC2_9BACT|nr:hypothetical protein C943_01359 [Mariniradius saccharolyticus AK6]
MNTKKKKEIQNEKRWLGNNILLPNSTWDFFILSQKKY